MFDDNIILLTDSYKTTHADQYPPGTRRVFSYFEARIGGRFPSTVFFGLQYLLRRYLSGQVVSRQKIDYAASRLKKHFGRDLFHRGGWEYIAHKCGGRLPLKIRAVPEGSDIPCGNVLVTVENTDDKCYWLTNYVESLLVQLWYPCTVATQSKAMKSLIRGYCLSTGGVAGLDMKLHDFGLRGVSSVETAALGGAAHLINFRGTDNLPSIEFLKEFYDEDMAGYSIPAAEHSTITSWGQDCEADAYENMIDRFMVEGEAVAVVADSYNIYDACNTIFGERLRDKIIQRAGTLVIRPDSGYPPDVTVKVLEILAHKFGGKKNDKGYFVLHPSVRVIYGDGIDYQMIDNILFKMKANGFSAENVSFGSGGGLLQKMDRDTQRFAFKASAVKLNDKWHDVYKSPVDSPNKSSKRGQLTLHKNDFGEYETKGLSDDNELQLVFDNGFLENTTTFTKVRERS